MSDDEFARFGARNALDGVYYLFYLTRTALVRPANHIEAPASTGALGGTPTQVGCFGRLSLERDEAAIITASAAGALFRNMVLTDHTWRTFNYWDRQTSLNPGQMAPDEDGRFTFVAAHEDLGVHNWLDAGGVRELKVGHRWQAFDRSRPRAGREAQIAARQAGCIRRFIDN